MSDESFSTTAAKASGITPTTALPNTQIDEKSSSKKSNLPASNPVPLPESPAIIHSDSDYPPPQSASRPPAPTGTSNNSAMAPTDRLSSLDDDTAPTRTTAVTTDVNLTDPPAPQPGAFPIPTTTTTTTTAQQTSHSPSDPRPGAAPSAPSETVAHGPSVTSIPAPTFTMPPVQTTYGPPEVTLRGQPVSGYTSTATSTSYNNNFPSAVRRTSDVAPVPGGYQQRENSDRTMSSEEAAREQGLLGKIGKAVDSLNEWMVGDKGGTSGV